MFFHARQRIDGRIAQAIGSNRAQSIARMVESRAKGCTSDTAALVAVLDEKITTGKSTGDSVWAIIRGGRVITFMLREKNRGTAGLRCESIEDWQ